MANFQAVKKRILFVAILLPIQGFSQSTNTILGAQACGMGYASSAIQNEWSFFGNMAGLTAVHEVTIASAYEVRALPGANRTGLVGAFPMKTGVTAIGAYRFGDDIYSEQSMQGAYAHRIGKTSLGIRAGYWQYRAEGFGTRGLLAISFGGITQLSNNFYLAAWIQNLNMPKIRFSEKQVAPIKLTASIVYKASESLLLTTEVEKDILYKVLWKAGLEYRVHKKLCLRTGLNLNPRAAFFGVGFQHGRIKIDYSLQGFGLLGPAHQASAAYRLNQKKQQTP